jgi:hypothetical protein
MTQIQPATPEPTATPPCPDYANGRPKPQNTALSLPGRLHKPKPACSTVLKMQASS